MKRVKDLRKIYHLGDIIKDPFIFDEKYAPKKVWHRESQIKTLINAFLISRENLLLQGATGTGKTAVCKYVRDQLMEYGKEIQQSIFIHCDNTNTAKKVFFNIAMEIAQLVKSRINRSELINEIKKNTDKKHYFIILDEIDKMNVKEFSTVVKAQDYLNISLICATNNVSYIYKLPSDIKHRLAASTILFPPYTSDELYNILKDRAELGFKKRSYDIEDLRYLAAKITQLGGDARLGIRSLFQAGIIATEKGRNKITKEDIDKGIEEIKRENITKTIANLTNPQKLILLLTLDVSQPITIVKEMYDVVSRRYAFEPISYKSIWENTRILMMNYGFLEGKYSISPRGKELRITGSPLITEQIPILQDMIKKDLALEDFDLKNIWKEYEKYIRIQEAREKTRQGK